MRTVIVSFLIAVAFAFLAQPVMATEVTGTAYSNGSPVANLTIEVKGTELKTRTGPNGQYRLDLPPGDHILVVRGREFPVSVQNNPTRLDIQL